MIVPDTVPWEQEGDFEGVLTLTLEIPSSGTVSVENHPRVGADGGRDAPAPVLAYHRGDAFSQKVL